MTLDAASLSSRLERFRQASARLSPASTTAPWRARDVAGPDLADRLAARLDGEAVRTRLGTVVRIERPAETVPIDRHRLGLLPGHPSPDSPLVFLDTETTGLGTAAGTLAFLIGLAWWEADRLRQVQLLLPDQADEPALLESLRLALPPGAWLVTYNGRTFDWPLLETRYRLRRADPPRPAGHLDLLPFVRRVFRHRLPDARLRTVETHVLGIRRIGDVEGREIPGRYLDVLRGATPDGLLDVVRHNHLDVLALAQLLAHTQARLADPAGRGSAHPGDLAGLGRAFRVEGRLAEALDCLDAALDRLEGPARRPVSSRPRLAEGWGDDDPGPAAWWSPRVRPDFGGRRSMSPAPFQDPSTTPWTVGRVAAERARILRRLDRPGDAVEAWWRVAAEGGRRGTLAWIEIAKLQEHVLGDPAGALGTVTRAWGSLERSRALGRPEPRLERELARRAARLRARLARLPGPSTGV